MFHPSFYTLSPIIGVCLIIWFSNKDELITKILSTKLFVGIGLISYSLYLWHYPIFAFGRIIEFAQLSLFYKLLLLLIILALSTFSYYFIESPFRKKNNKFKFIISLILILISIIVIFNISVIRKDGYNNTFPDILLKNLSEQPEYLLKNFEGKICSGNIEECRFNTSSNEKVYIIGDSHMSPLIFNLINVVKKDYKFFTFTRSACLFFPEFNLINKKNSKTMYECDDDYFQKLKQTLSIEKNSIIIFGGRFPLFISGNYFNNQEGGIEGKEWRNKYVSVGRYDNIQISFKNEILELSKNNKIILIYPIPEVGWDPNKQIYNQWIKQRFNKNFNLTNVTTSYEVYTNRTKSSFELLNSIQGENIYRVYPHTLFCNTVIYNRCVTHDDKNIFYSDDDHLSL